MGVGGVFLIPLPYLFYIQLRGSFDSSYFLVDVHEIILDYLVDRSLDFFIVLLIREFIGGSGDPSEIGTGVIPLLLII